MTVGNIYVVQFHMNTALPPAVPPVAATPVLDKLDFSGTFSYTGAYTSNVVVQMNDIADTPNNVFVVTYYWAHGSAPNLAAVSVNSFLTDAIAQVSAVLPGEPA